MRTAKLNEGEIYSQVFVSDDDSCSYYSVDNEYYTSDDDIVGTIHTTPLKNTPSISNNNKPKVISRFYDDQRGNNQEFNKCQTNHIYASLHGSAKSKARLVTPRSSKSISSTSDKARDSNKAQYNNHKKDLKEFKKDDGSTDSNSFLYEITKVKTGLTPPSSISSITNQPRDSIKDYHYGDQKRNTLEQILQEFHELHSRIIENVNNEDVAKTPPPKSPHGINNIKTHRENPEKIALEDIRVKINDLHKRLNENITSKGNSSTSGKMRSSVKDSHLKNSYYEHEKDDISYSDSWLNKVANTQVVTPPLSSISSMTKSKGPTKTHFEAQRENPREYSEDESSYPYSWYNERVNTRIVTPPRSRRTRDYERKTSTASFEPPPSIFTHFTNNKNKNNERSSAGSVSDIFNPNPTTPKTRDKTVYVAKSMRGACYHAREDCYGLRSAYEVCSISKEGASMRGMRKCKLCYKNEVHPTASSFQYHDYYDRNTPSVVVPSPTEETLQRTITSSLNSSHTTSREVFVASSLRGTCYHSLNSCFGLRRSNGVTSVELNYATKMGMRPCKLCSYERETLKPDNQRSSSERISSTPISLALPKEGYSHHPSISNMHLSASRNNSSCYYTTSSGQCYHSSRYCSSLRRSSNIQEQSCIPYGKRPCRLCCK